MTLAQYLFAPRGFSTLVRHSVRAVRRQTNVLSDVGEDLAQESLRALREPLRRWGRPRNGGRNE